MGKITALEVQKRSKERVNVYIDGEFAFALTLIEAARLKKGQSLSPEEIAALRAQDDLAKALDSALRFIAYRPRSVQEVRRHLAAKQQPPDVIAAAVERLSAQGYLDDLAFARFWVENRDSFKPLSPQALRQELLQKGVPRALIDEALADIDPEDAAYRAALTQAPRLRTTNRRDFQHKLAAFLQRRGFSFALARTVIRRVLDTIDQQQPDRFAASAEPEDEETSGGSDQE
ncbi:MAG: RecX family transcriptional regulator [Chloroflexi bacterium]|nr:RecX family transcriptional regulator [Chloroflexota bacterium]